MNYYLMCLFIPFIFPSIAVAKCTGTNIYSTSYDDNGNQYNVQRYGNRTTVNGYNPNTGSNWSQNSNTIGNTTYQNGIDSQGNSYYKTCTTNYNGKKAVIKKCYKISSPNPFYVKRYKSLMWRFIASSLSVS